MSLADQFTTLKALAHDLKQKSIAHVLQSVIDANMMPIVPIPSDWHVFLACWIALQSPRQPMSDLALKHRAFYMQDVQCIELEKSVCTHLIQDGQVVAKTVEVVHVASAGSTGLSRRSAKQPGIDPACFKPIPNTLQILWPCFALFHEPVTNLLTVGRRNSLEDFKCLPGIVVRIEELRLLPSDETKIRKKFSSQVKEPVSIEISGEHISTQFGQLLDVFNVHRQHMHEALRAAHPISRRQDAEQHLHQSLQNKDSNAWCSETLRKIAIQLIFPSPPPNRRSKKPPPYRADGIPVKLAALLENLQKDYSKVLVFDTQEYINWLISELSMTEKEARAITTIARLTPSNRGGRRAKKSPQP